MSYAYGVNLRNRSTVLTSDRSVMLVIVVEDGSEKEIRLETGHKYLSG